MGNYTQANSLETTTHLDKVESRPHEELSVRKPWSIHRITAQKPPRIYQRKLPYSFQFRRLHLKRISELCTQQLEAFEHAPGDLFDFSFYRLGSAPRRLLPHSRQNVMELYKRNL